LDSSVSILSKLNLRNCRFLAIAAGARHDSLAACARLACTALSALELQLLTNSARGERASYVPEVEVCSGKT